MNNEIFENKRTVRVSGKDVSYYLKFNDNQKNIILRVKNDAIHISAPRHAQMYEIELLIQKHYAKISQIQVNYEINNKYDLFAAQPWVKIFDQKINIFLVEENINTKMNENGILMKNYHNTEEQLKKLYSFLGKYYKNWFINQTMDWAFKMNQLEFNNLTVKVMKGKWGACYANAKRLLFNTKLLHFDKQVIDSVIIHELVHLMQPNHSQQFWKYVHRFCPNYKELDKILNSAGI